jgi:uncharacterized protein YbjT (DUF2867 family)
MILITGATGTVGSEVITALLPAQASHIRVLIPEAVQNTATTGESLRAPPDPASIPTRWS